MITQIATLASIMQLGMMLMILDRLPALAAMVFVLGMLLSGACLAREWGNDESA